MKILNIGSEGSHHVGDDERPNTSNLRSGMGYNTPIQSSAKIIMNTKDKRREEGYEEQPVESQPRLHGIKPWRSFLGQSGYP